MPIVMEDNAPVHKKVCIPVREALRMETLEWPPNSPDLNPIENISPSWLWRFNSLHPKVRGYRLTTCGHTRAGDFAPDPLFRHARAGDLVP